jgi:hypothetical protein
MSPTRSQKYQKIIVVISLFICSSVKAQHVENFAFKLPDYKVKNSLYNSLIFIDARVDTMNLGAIQTGAFNRFAPIVPKYPLHIQFANIFNGLIDVSAKQAGLIFQLRRLRFTELTNGANEWGYFSFRAAVYAKSGNDYQEINTIDTVVKLSSMIDVSNPLLKRGTEVVTNFIAKNLVNKPTLPIPFKFREILKVDSVEKRMLKIYNTKTYRDGLYVTYGSFSEQIPDASIIVQNEVRDKNSVQALDQNKRPSKITPSGIYAVVYKGIPYVATPYGYYNLTKIDDNLFFKGKVATGRSNDGAIILGGILGGALGGAIVGSIAASTSSTQSFFGEVKINHLNGQFILIRELRE